jgi:hypothetical protein
MTDYMPKYASPGKPVTITLDNLGSSATDGRESTAVDNTSDLYARVWLHVQVKTNAAALANDKCCYIYAYPIGVNSTPADVYPDGITGSDAALAAIHDKHLMYLGAIDCPTSSTIYKKSFPVHLSFGGVMPRKWGIVVRNYTGQALDNAGGQNLVSYYGEQDQGV